MSSIPLPLVDDLISKNTSILKIGLSRSFYSLNDLEKMVQNAKLMDYFCKKIDDVMDFLLFTKPSNDNERISSINISQLLAKMIELTQQNSINIISPNIENAITKKLACFVEKYHFSSGYDNQFSQIQVSNFSTILKEFLFQSKGEYLRKNPTFSIPILSYPNEAGYSMIIIQLLRYCDEYFELVTERVYEFVRNAHKSFTNNDGNYSKYIECSYFLINSFNKLIIRDYLNVEKFDILCTKNILDAAFFFFYNCKNIDDICSPQSKNIVFYEGISFTARLLKKVEKDSPIPRYIKQRGKTFYEFIGLPDMKEIQYDKLDFSQDPSELLKDPKLKLCLEVFPAFYESGYKYLWPLLFFKYRSISADFGRTLIDYITKMDKEKLTKFINNNDITKKIEKSFPLYPADKEFLENEERFFNPHILLLAVYLGEGLPPNRDEEPLQMKLSNYDADQDFQDFVNEKVRKFYPLVFVKNQIESS